MPALPNDFDKITDLISSLDPNNLTYRIDINNITALVGLSSTLSLQEKQQFSIRLFYLGLETQTTQSMKIAKK